MYAGPGPMLQGMDQRVTRRGGKRPRVLIVDDERDVADSLSALLELLDYDVRVTYSGHAAVDVAGAYRPNVVILDMNMPGMDGLQTARRLKKDRRLAGVAFVAHSAADEPLVRRVAKQIGFRHFVTKGDLSSTTALLDILLEIEGCTSSGA